MEYKKTIILLALVVFLLSIAGVSASEIEDNIASEDTNTAELSADNDIIEDNLQTSEENDELTLTDNDVLGADSATYSDLASEISQSGNVKLTHKNYTYNTGATAITITEANKVIDGDGAVIDMAGSTIRAFTISTSGVTIKNLTIKNANYNGNGGAIYFSSSGTVTNCNFADNKATGDYSYGGAVFFYTNGEVTNCNFTNNQANGTNSWGGAIMFGGTGNVTNCNFADNSAAHGGAIRFISTGTVTNCNFADNTATYGGAVYFLNTGNVANCNFTNNKAEDYGGAIRMNSGTVTNCNFTNNHASYGGAVYFLNNGEVRNCNFTNNQANYEGGAIWISSGSVENCNFADNSANRGGAIFSYYWYTAADTCIFKRNSGENFNVVIYPPTLNVDNFTTFYGSGEKLTFNLTTDSGMPVNNGNISISVYFKDNSSWVGNYSCLSGEGWAVSLPVGSYYANFTTEYAGFQAINRTIKIIPNIPYYVNVTPVTTNNRTVNITAKSNLPQDILEGKLLFILPNSTQINANYAGNGTWWAVHTFDDYAVYQVNASYEGLNNVTVSNAKITINKVDSTITLDNITLNYGESRNVTVATQGATGITADINGTNATVINNYTIQIADLAAGNYTLTVTTIPDGDHNPVTATSKITVNKIESTLTVNNVELDYGDSINVTVTALGATGITAKIDNVNVTVKGYTIPISGLDVGTYTLTVTTIADANHNPVTRNATVTVNRAKTELTADAIITTYSVSKNLVITLKDSNDRPLSGLNITVDLNGTKNYTTDTNGQVKISTNGLAANIYDVGISFNGTDNYLNSSNTTTVSIYKESSRVDTKPLTTDYNVHKYLVVGLKDNEGNPIRNADAFIEIHGVTYKCRSDDAGDARLIIRLNPGTYTAKITFDNVNYTGFTQYVTVIVKKLTPKLTAKKKTFKKSKKVKKYTVTLKDNTGKAIKKVKLTLKVKGKTYKAKTNNKGKATFKIKKLTKKGKYKATVTYKGNNCYNKVTKKVTIKIK